MTNSIARTGGIPGNSAGKTSGKSQTTLTSSIKGATPAFRAYNCANPVVEPQVYQISLPESCVSLTDLDGQSMLALCCTSQSIPRMTSMSKRGSKIKEAGNMQPWISILTNEARTDEAILEPGETIDNEPGKSSKDRTCSSANLWETKEWEAPESNNTVAGTELTSNLPSTISDDCWASVTVTLFTRSARGWARTIALLGVE